MSSSKTFVIPVNPRDVLVDLAGVSDKAGLAYMRFWMLHALHGEPLPPREEKKPRDEWDAWFRDKLGMKNVRTWIRARDELLQLGKIRESDDGRLYIGRTMRAAERRRGGDPSKWTTEGDGQGAFDLQGVHPAQLPRDAQAGVEKPVEDAGEVSGSAEVPSMIARTSAEVTPILLPKSLIYRNSQSPLSYSKSKSHEVVAVPSPVAARARGDPTTAQA